MMTSKFRRLSGKILQVLNVVLVIILLLGAYSWKFSPNTWWLVAIAGLIFPALLVVTVIDAILLLLFRKKTAGILIIGLLLCIPAILRCYAFNKEKPMSANKNPTQLRVLTWNVGLMSFGARDTVQAIEQNIQILNEIKRSDADVLCLQEFLTSEIPNGHYNFMDSIKRTMNYPYRYFCIDRSNINGFFTSGTLIMSRYPIIDTLRAEFAPPFAGSVAGVTIRYEQEPIQIFTTRLQSLNFSKEDYAIFDNLKKANVQALDGSKGMFKKIKYGYQNRKEQVQRVSSLINNSTYPVLFMGDLNDLPNSYAYAKIKGNFTDVWLEHGNGLGRTFRKIAPNLRIDYIFAGPEFKSNNIKRIMTTGSDHYGLLADFERIKKAP